MTETNRETKNAVFASSQPQVPTQQPQRDPLLDDPADLAPLPSNGLLYPVEHPFHGLAHVEIKALTAKEENILMNQAYAKKGTSLTELLRSCIIDKSVDPESLLLSDRNSLMVAIRSAGYGSHYEDEVTCSDEDCGKKTTRHFDLSKFEIKRLDASLVSQPGTNLFKFKLPSGRTVEFRLLTGQDERDMHIAAERQKKALNTDANDSVTASLFRSIVSVDGVTDRARLSRFVENMRGTDSVALRRYISDITPGIKMTQVMSCPLCGHEEEVNMPLGITFLWPSARTR